MFNIRSKVADKLLGYYFINPQARQYINELARIIDVDPSNLDKQLKKMEAEGFFSSEMQGNQKYFFLNKKYPLLGELKKMYALKYGVEQKLTQKLKNIKGLREAYIFGSYAKNTFGPESDIDILLIGSHSSIEAKRCVATIESEIKRELNVVDMTEQEFSSRKKKKDEFIGNIFKNKIIRII